MCIKENLSLAHDTTLIFFMKLLTSARCETVGGLGIGR